MEVTYAPSQYQREHVLCRGWEKNATLPIRASFLPRVAQLHFSWCGTIDKSSSMNTARRYMKRQREQTMAEVFEGQCQCGDVAYRVIGQSLALFACHCSECQRQSSSAFGMALWVKESGVELMSGSLRSWVRRTPTGRQMVCQFCPVCGSRIFHQLMDQEGIISIKPGTLNNTKRLQPVAHIWTRSAQPWVEFREDCLVYLEDPDSFEAMLKAWQEKIRQEA